LKNRTPSEIEQAVVALAIEQPAWGPVRISEALKRRGLSISPAGLQRLPFPARLTAPLGPSGRAAVLRHGAGFTIGIGASRPAAGVTIVFLGARLSRTRATADVADHEGPALCPAR
jgi:hypothetical protein